MKFEQYLLREYGMTRKEEIEKTFWGNVDALSRILTPVDIFTLGAAAVAKLTGKKVLKEVGEEVGEKTVKTVAGETREILEKELVEGTIKGTVKEEFVKEVTENTTKKEMKDTAADLSQKIVSAKNVLKELDSNNPFYKSSGGSNLDDFMTIHAEKHVYNPNVKSTKNRTQFGENINVAKLREDTMLYPDKIIYDSEHNMIKYVKEYNFNISTSDTPTGSHRVFINLETKAGKTNRNSQFPYYRGDK